MYMTKIDEIVAISEKYGYEFLDREFWLMQPCAVISLILSIESICEGLFDSEEEFDKGILFNKGIIFTCTKCYKNLPVSKGLFDSNGNFYCEKCFVDGSFTCERCWNSYHKNDRIIKDGVPYCKTCIAIMEENK